MKCAHCKQAAAVGKCRLTWLSLCFHCYYNRGLPPQYYKTLFSVGDAYLIYNEGFPLVSPGRDVLDTLLEEAFHILDFPTSPVHASTADEGIKSVVDQEAYITFYRTLGQQVMDELRYIHGLKFTLMSTPTTKTVTLGYKTAIDSFFELSWGYVLNDGKKNMFLSLLYRKAIPDESVPYYFPPTSSETSQQLSKKKYLPAILLVAMTTVLVNFDEHIGVPTYIKLNAYDNTSGKLLQAYNAMGFSLDVETQYAESGTFYNQPYSLFLRGKETINSTPISMIGNFFDIFSQCLLLCDKEWQLNTIVPAYGTLKDTIPLPRGVLPKQIDVVSNKATNLYESYSMDKSKIPDMNIRKSRDEDAHYPQIPQKEWASHLKVLYEYLRSLWRNHRSSMTILGGFQDGLPWFEADSANEHLWKIYLETHGSPAEKKELQRMRRVAKNMRLYAMSTNPFQQNQLVDDIDDEIDV